MDKTVEVPLSSVLSFLGLEEPLEESLVLKRKEVLQEIVRINSYLDFDAFKDFLERIFPFYHDVNWPLHEIALDIISEFNQL